VTVVVRGGHPRGLLTLERLTLALTWLFAGETGFWLGGVGEEAGWWWRMMMWLSFLAG